MNLLFEDGELEAAVQRSIERHEISGEDIRTVWDQVNEIEMAHAALENVRSGHLEIHSIKEGKITWIKAGQPT